jgi:hypothetical protein
MPRRRIAAEMRSACWIATAAVLAVVLGGCGERATVDPPRRAPQAGPQLLLAGDQRLSLVDVARERVREIALPELTPGDPPLRILRRGNRFVLWGYATYLWAPEREALSPLVPDSWFFLPSAHRDRVWVAFLDPDSPSTARAIRAVREVTIDGEVTVPDAQPPGGRWPIGPIRGGLLVATANDRGVRVWDPAADRVHASVPIANLTNLGPTQGDRLVSCARRCRLLELINVRTGRRRRITAPRGTAFETWNAEFSPSGSRLAVPVRSLGRRRSPLRLAIVDLARRRVAVVPGSAVPPGYTLATWSSSGRDVFLSGGALARRTITWYRRGEDRARPLHVSVGGFFDMAAR